jgi:hypothetical protein
MTAATVSNPVGTLDDAWGLTIQSPTFTASAVSVQVELTDTGTNFVTLQSGGADVLLPPSRATVISPVPFRQIKILSSNSETATFTLAKAILV